MQTIYSTPELHAVASKGNTKYWMGHVLEDGDKYYTQSSFWQQTKDGLSLVQKSEPSLVKGKNAGRSNETTDRAQAFLEIESDFKRYKERKGYLEEGETTTNKFVKPMLAHKYKDRIDKVEWKQGNYAQPKRDGARLLMNSNLGTAWSRQSVEFHADVVKMFMFDTAGYTLDGELMLPQGYSQQQLMSAAATVKAKHFSPLMPLLELHLFDVVIEDLPFHERLVILKEILTHAPSNLRIQLLETRFVSTPEEFQSAHEVWCAAGDEGSMLRDGSSGYKIGHRSNSLLKHKDFIDDEFTIIDVVDGKGKFAGKAVFSCITKDGKTFEVAPKGTMAVKANIFQKKDQYIGEPLTVQFQKYSDNGIPIFPVGLALRGSAF